MRKIRVLQFPVANSKGGITQYVLQNWKYIDRSRFQFDFATMSKSLSFAEQLEKDGCKIYYISCYAEENKKKFIEEFRRILSEGDYDVVHLHTKQWKSFLVEQIAKEVGIKKIIIHAHSSGIDTLDKEKREKEIQLHDQVRENLRECIATDFWTCSWKAADFIFGNKIPGSKIKLMNNAIDLLVYAYNPETRKKYREMLGISDDECTIGNVGRFVYPKNQEFLIEVFSEVCKSNKKSQNKYKLLLVGAGEREQEYRKIVQEKELTENVIFAGQRTDVPELLQAMDIFCLPSRFEGFPIALIEAQAAGLPCLVSNLVTDEIIKNEKVIMKELELEVWKQEIFKLDTDNKKQNRNIFLSKEYEIGTQIKKIEQGYCEI